MDYFTRLKKRYTKVLTEEIIPFWEQYGIDKEYGGFFSFLEQDGSLYDTKKPMWMQWRAVYMFAALYNSRFKKEDYLLFAEKGFDFLVKNGKTSSSAYAFMLDRKGKILAEKEGGSEVFSESFAAIACAELYIATKEKKYEEEAFHALEIYLQNTAKKPSMTYYPLAYPMILLNVLDIMQKAFGEKIGEEKIRECVEEIFSFLHPQKNIFLENRLLNGSFDLESQTGRFTNPGHALEGLAFILEILRKRKETDPLFVEKYLSKALFCVEKTFQYGWDKEQGGITYFRDILDKPLYKNECMLKAWWPQNEAATAVLRAYEASGQEHFLDHFEKIDAFSFLHLQDPRYPEWFAYASVNGRQTHSYKASTWKGFFHLPRFLLNSIEICDRLEEKK